MDMRRLSMFAAGFAVMMVAGIAAAQFGGAPTESSKGDVAFGVVESTEATKIQAPEQLVEDEESNAHAAIPDETSETKPAPDEPEDWPETDKAEPDPADPTPREFAILHPEQGQTFDKKEVAFEGVVEPGSRVFAGDYEAEVDDAGNWRIVLWLSPGQNVATLKAVDPAGNTTTASVTVGYEAGEEAAEETGEDKPKDDEPSQDKPKEEEPGQDNPKEEGSSIEFSIDQKFRSCDSAEPYEVFWGTGRPGLVIEFISAFGDRRIEVGESGEWTTEVFFHEVPVNDPFDIVVETSDGHREVFTFVWTGKD